MDALKGELPPPLRHAIPISAILSAAVTLFIAGIAEFSEGMRSSAESRLRRCATRS